MGDERNQHRSAQSEPGLEVAVLAGGCFWGVEDILRGVPGVVDTEVGYTGGWLENPTYDDTHDGKSGHAEAVRITFDPSIISYEDLLEKWFFKLHDPTTLNRQGNDRGTQYRSAIFPQTPEQQRAAERVKARVEASGQLASAHHDDNRASLALVQCRALPPGLLAQAPWRLHLSLHAGVAAVGTFRVRNPSLRMPTSADNVWAVLAWGGVSSVGLLVGAIAGTFGRMPHHAIAMAMSVGAGLLLAGVSLKVAADAITIAGPVAAALSLLLGATAFSASNALLARFGAAHRKRCGDCIQQPAESEQPGSGVAIALGNALDAVPGAVVLGIALQDRIVPLALVFAFSVGNLPEALSSAAGMRVAGRSYTYIFLALECDRDRRSDRHRGRVCGVRFAQ